MSASGEQTLGLYIHIPFCRSKCDYCDFYSLSGREADMDNYLHALITHIRQTAPSASHLHVDTIYFGGGTPSIFGLHRLMEVLTELNGQFHVVPDAEITLEGNPDSVNIPLLTSLRNAGFNRLSLGVQSACDEHLRTLHRPHTFSQAQQAVVTARTAGFDNVSLDLIYGLPNQSMTQWQDTVEQVLLLEPKHLSCYGLKVEENTPLYARVQQGEILPDDDAQADMYLWMVSRLEQAGYHQYEISNFARPGMQSRHNLRYWLTRPYLGFGPGAHSDFDGQRYSFVRDLNKYMGGVLSGQPIVDQCQPISTSERASEYLMLRLRTARGIEPEEYSRIYSMNFAPLELRLKQYEQHGWTQRCGSRWRLTAEGFLLSNQLIGQLLDAQLPTHLEQNL